MRLDIIKKIDTYVGIPLVRILSVFKKRKKSPPKKINKILCMKFFGFGNIILISPSLKSLRRKYSKAQIDFLTLKQNRGILEAYGLTNKNYYLSFSNIFDLVLETFRTIIRLRKEKYDLVIDFEPFARYSAIISFLISPKYSIGFMTDKQQKHYLYDTTTKYEENKHIVESFHSLVENLIKRNEKKSKKIKLVKFNRNHKTAKLALKKVGEFLEKNKINSERLIGIHVGVSKNAQVRKWPPQYFAALINKIIEKYPKYNIILTGSKNDKEDINTVIRFIDPKIRKKVHTSYSISLKELPYLIEKCRVFISNDTGPLHVAAAQGIWVIGLYGPNTPTLYGPYTDKKIVFYKSLPCSPCVTNFNNKESSCKNNICMKLISVNEVLEAVEKLLKKFE